MPTTVIVGGQFGSEGKGKVALYLAKAMSAAVVVRVGGPNSGHTAYDALGRKHIFRQLPTAALLPDPPLCVLPAGSYIDVEILLAEVAQTHLPPSRLAIDHNAVLIQESDSVTEAQSGLRDAIGSTLSGTGAAVERRLRRRANLPVAAQNRDLEPFMCNAAAVLRGELGSNRRVLVEGTQGFGLSLLHSPSYPFVTSRDTTAAGFASEAGISPLDVDDVVVVLRTYPIRVSGNSGPLPNEITWSDVTTSGNHPSPLVEYTSVTQQERRVAKFDFEVVKQALIHNAPTRLVLNHVDHIDPHCARTMHLTRTSEAFVKYLEEGLQRKIDFLGFGPDSLVSRNTAFGERAA